MTQDDIVTVPERQSDARTVDIRRSHPNLYYAITILAVACIALGLNFLLTTPTFSPLNIPKEVIGITFMVLGVSKMILLNFHRDLKLLRVVMAITFSFIMFWGLINSRQAFAGKSSFQLSIVYLTIAALEFPLLIEGSVNPYTERKKK